MRPTDRTIRSARPRWQHAVALGAVAALALGACGGDDDDDDAAGDGDTPAYCQTYADAQMALTAAMMTEEGDPSAALGALQDDAPEEIASDAETFVTELMAVMGGPEGDAPEGDAAEAPDGGEDEAGGPPPIPGPEYFSASEALGDWAVENCDFSILRVTTRDYEFGGIPGDVGAGLTLVKLTNEGGEWHEIFAGRVADGEERSLEELLELPEEESEDLVEPVGFVFTPPGTSVYTVMDFSAGRHVALCFIPVGTTTAAIESGEEGDGPPHFMEGMQQEFQVS